VDWWSVKVHYRPRDMSSALTEMLGRDATSGDLLHNTIDRRYVVAAGHSLGGYAAFTEICGDDQVCDVSEIASRDGHKNPPTSICTPTPPDPRFTALMTLDGHAGLLRWEELSRIRVPSLIMGGAFFADGDYSPWAPGAESFISRPHAAICSQTRAVRVDLRLTEHVSFGDACDGLTILHNAGWLSDEVYNAYAPEYCPGAYGLPLLPEHEIYRMITKYAVAWLRAEVVKDGNDLSKRILTQAYAKAHEPNVEVYWDEGCSTGGTIPAGTFTYWTNMVSGACVVGDKNPADYFIQYP
jgi:hypothetical protein